MKALIVILAIAGVTYWLAKPVALRFIDPVDFQRRRNVWFTLTIIEFLSPTFWVFAIFAIPIYIWIGKKDSNPTAAYLLLLHVIPPVSVAIPTMGIGIGELFNLDNYRLLSFCILVPTALRVRRSSKYERIAGSRATDLLLVAYGAMGIALFVPADLPGHVILQDSLTNLLRRGFLVIVDIFVLYYAISRSCGDRRKIVDALAAFCLSNVVIALIATFEHLKTWLLYTELAKLWNPNDANFIMAWLFRGDSWLRAQASTGHPLSLGVLLATAFGFWLYLQPRASSNLRVRVGIGVIFWSGMLAAFSRGPWIGAVLIYLAYSALKPRAISRLFKAFFIVAVLLGLISLSSVGERLMSSLPFSGGRPDAAFLYRQRLADRTLELIEAHPFFGDQLAIQKMEDLRQGQGIIDIVNTYVGVALFSGLVGLALFLGFIFSAGVGVFRAAKATTATDPEGGLLGFNILACIIGVLFMIADCSLIYGVEKIFYVLIALATAYSRQNRKVPSIRSAESNNRLTPRAISNSDLLT